MNRPENWKQIARKFMSAPAFSLQVFRLFYTHCDQSLEGLIASRWHYLTGYTSIRSVNQVVDCCLPSGYLWPLAIASWDWRKCSTRKKLLGIHAVSFASKKIQPIVLTLPPWNCMYKLRDAVRLWEDTENLESFSSDRKSRTLWWPTVCLCGLILHSSSVTSRGSSKCQIGA